MGIKLLHTADLHLDRPFLGLGQRRLARRAEMRARFEEILALAREREVAALLIAGDLFDRPTAESGLWVKSNLANLAARGTRVFLIPGNHDSFEHCAFYHGDFPEGVHVFKTPEFQACRALPGLTIHGLAYHDTDRHRNPLAGFVPAPGEGWHVALVHGQLRSSDLVGEDYAPVEPREVAACGLDYLALGHYHGFKDCSAGRTKAFYPGSPHRLDFSDTAARQVLLVELAEGGVTVEPITLPDRQFLLVTGDAGRPELLYDQLLGVAGPDVYIRVRLTGRAQAPVAGLVADLEDKFAGRCYGFEVQAAEVTTHAPAAQTGTVAHAFARLMADRLAAAPDEETANALRLAADYGLLALEGRQLP